MCRSDFLCKAAEGGKMRHPTQNAPATCGKTEHPALVQKNTPTGSPTNSKEARICKGREYNNLRPQCSAVAPSCRPLAQLLLSSISQKAGCESQTFEQTS